MMQYNNRIKRSSLVDNPNARIPVCFCIDSSTSMFFKFKNLKKGIENFYKEVKQDNSIRYSVDLLLTSFSNEPKVVEEFDCVDQHKDKYIQTRASQLSAQSAARASSRWLPMVWRASLTCS